MPLRRWSPRPGLEAPLLRPLRALFGSAGPGMLDVFFADRLLLLRNPDREGWVHYLREVRKETLTLESLSASFLASDEFRSVRRRPADTEDYETRPIEEQIVTVDGLQLVVDRHDEGIGRAISNGRSEPASVEIIRTLVRPGHTFVDAGANVGFFVAKGPSCCGRSRRTATPSSRWNRTCAESDGRASGRSHA